MRPRAKLFIPFRDLGGYRFNNKRLNAFVTCNDYRFNNKRLNTFVTYQKGFYRQFRTIHQINKSTIQQSNSCKNSLSSLFYSNKTKLIAIITIPAINP